MSVYRRDLRYLVTYLWSGWMAILLVGLPFLLGMVLLIPWATFVSHGTVTLAGALVDGRKLASFALVVQLGAALLVAPFVGVRLVLIEAQEGTLDLLQVARLTGLEVYLAKLGVALTLGAPFLCMQAPLLAAAWVQGWLTGPAIVVALALTVALVVVGTALAMTVAALARAPEVAYPAAALLLGVLCAAPPPLTGHPASLAQGLGFSPFAAAFLGFLYRGDALVEPLEWAGAFAWCAGAGAGAVWAGTRFLAAGDVAARRRWLGHVPYLLGGAAVIALGADALAGGTRATVPAGVVGLAVAGLTLALHWRASRPGREGAGSGARAGWLARRLAPDAVARKERAFYETGNLRVLRDFLVLGVAASALFWLVAGAGSAGRAATFGPWPILHAAGIGLMVLGAMLGATSLTLERSRNTHALLLLTPLPMARIYRCKWRGILLYLAPVGATALAFALVAGEPSPAQAAGTLLSALCLGSWVFLAVLWGMTGTAAAQTNAQAISTLAGTAYAMQALFRGPGATPSGTGGMIFSTLFATVSPFFHGEHAVALGADLPAWDPLGRGSFVIFGVLTWYLSRWMCRYVPATAATQVDPWGEAQKQGEKPKVGRRAAGAPAGGRRAEAHPTGPGAAPGASATGGRMEERHDPDK